MMKQRILPAIQALALLMTIGSLAPVAVHAQSASERMIDQTENRSLATRPGFFGEHLSRMRMSFNSFSSVNAEYANQAAGRLESSNYVSLDYRVTDKQWLKIRPTFSYDFAGTNYKGEYSGGGFKIDDPYIDYGIQDSFRLPKRWGSMTGFRYYAPVSDESKRRQSGGSISTFNSVSHPLFVRGLDISASFLAVYYFNRATGVLNDRGLPSANRNYGFTEAVDIRYRFAKRFSISQSLGYETYYNHEMALEEIERDHTAALKTDTSLGYSMGSFSTSVGVSQSHDTRRPRNEFALYRREQSKYNFNVNIRF